MSEEELLKERRSLMRRRQQGWKIFLIMRRRREEEEGETGEGANEEKFHRKVELRSCFGEETPRIPWRKD